MIIKKLKRDRILIFYIILLLSAGSILSSNWSYFIKNKHSHNDNISSYKINILKNYYVNYFKEEANIQIQINILNGAIKKNSLIYKQYNDVFKNNINYIHTQRNNIINKIRNANYSINHEIDILNNMKIIINNHPYDYLTIFQSKNYVIPVITRQKTINNYSIFNDIKTKEHNINNTNKTIKNISYQSEEATVGIGAISSIMSSLKTLIFSKKHFNYNSVYYYSSKLNNLLTINNSNQIGNKMLNITNSNIKINDHNNINKIYKNTLLFSKNKQKLGKKVINYLKLYKFEDSACSALILGVIGGSISFLWWKLRRIIIKKVYRMNEIKETKIRLNIKKEDEHLASIGTSLDGISNLDNSEINFRLYEEADDAFIDRYIANPKRRVVYSVEKIIGDHQDYDNIHNVIDDETEVLMQTLYDDIPNKTTLSFYDFKLQLINYARIKKRENIGNLDLNRLQTYITRITINTHAVKIHDDSTRSLFNQNVAIIKKITSLNGNRDIPIELAEQNTTNGWFSIPRFQAPIGIYLTQEEDAFVKEQIENFNMLLESIPEFKIIGEDKSVYEIISHQMLQDLKELIHVYKNHLESVYENTGRSLEKTNTLIKIPREIRVRNYYNELQATRTAKSKLADMSHLGITDEQLSAKIWDISYLIHGLV